MKTAKKISVLLFNLFCFTQIALSQDVDVQNYEDDIVMLNTGGNSMAAMTCNNCAISNFRFWPTTNIPATNTVIRKVKIDFNVLQDGSGGGNFINDATDIHIGITRLNNIFGWINGLYNADNNGVNNIPPAGVIVNDLPKEYIQFELGNIYFYDNATYFRCSNIGNLLTLVSNDPNRMPNEIDNRLQMFFSEGFYNGSVSHIAITNGGSGYTTPPNISFSSGLVSCQLDIVV